MNAEDTRTIPPEGEFDPHRLRSITDMKRSRNDRMLGGVCAGAAKYLNIDPVIVRVVIAVLTIVGFAGVIIYAAAWFLLPAEGEAKSVAADWFRLDKNEEQVRVAGLVGAIVLAALAVVGDGGWFWDGAPWILVPFGLAYYLFVVRPRRRRQAETALAAEYAPTAEDPADESARGPELTAAKAGLVTRGKLAKSQPDRSWTLTLLTLSVTAIAAAATGIYDAYNDGPHWTAYVAVALGVVAVGLLVSTLIGNGGPLIGIGAILALTLTIGSLVPGGQIGTQSPTPTTAVQVDPNYRHGIGLIELDLTDVANPEALLGRTIEIETGIGQTRVIVPDGLNVRVTSDIDAGEIRVFDRKTDGTDTQLTYGAAAPGPALRLDLHQRLGNIEVIRR
ncbi:PspC domain-containing protein [Aeromicrobium sp. NPDC092404]|uniref:PspC domain-containing protein n=1 Tax=Aeromicrobium sp. NPDC092404 TaxID=3154976 RepID=UPI003416AF49